jgi:hypothetical protein
VLDAGGVIQSFTIDKKGNARSGASSMSLHAKGGAGVFKVRLSKGSFAAALQDEGFVNADIEAALTVPVIVLFDGKMYLAQREVLYKAKKAKSGSAK